MDALCGYGSDSSSSSEKETTADVTQPDTIRNTNKNITSSLLGVDYSDSDYEDDVINNEEVLITKKRKLSLSLNSTTSPKVNTDDRTKTSPFLGSGKSQKYKSILANFSSQLSTTTKKKHILTLLNSTTISSLITAFPKLPTQLTSTTLKRKTLFGETDKLENVLICHVERMERIARGGCDAFGVALPY